MFMRDIYLPWLAFIVTKRIPLISRCFIQ